MQRKLVLNLSERCNEVICKFPLVLNCAPEVKIWLMSDHLGFSLRRKSGLVVQIEMFNRSACLIDKVNLGVRFSIMNLTCLIRLYLERNPSAGEKPLHLSLLLLILLEVRVELRRSIGLFRNFVHGDKGCQRGDIFLE